MCPPTWNPAIGSVPLRIARVGERRRPVQPSSGRLQSRQRPATKKNCTMVRVTGNLKWLRMTLPVFEESAEDVYHKEHSATKRIVSSPGTVTCGIAKGWGEGERR